MKAAIAIIIIIILGGLFFLYSSKAPEGVERAAITDEDMAGTTDTSSGMSADANGVTGTSTTGTAATNLTINAGAGVALDISSKYKVEDFTFTFTGYGPGGKVETGTFKNMTVGSIATDAKGNPTSGKLTIETASVTTGKAGLDKHLCSDDFFNCEKYPNIVFTYKSIKMVGLAKATVTGTLEYNGSKKDVSFDVAIDPKTMSASADFLLDTTPFKFKYAGVNKDVRIQFGFKVSEVK